MLPNATQVSDQVSETLAQYLHDSPYSKYLNFEVARFKSPPEFYTYFKLDPEKLVLYTLPFRPDFIGNSWRKRYHGGVIAAFLESIAGLTTWLSLNSRALSLPKTIDSHIDYLAPAQDQDLYAHACVLKAGKNVMLIQCTAWQYSEKQQLRAVAIARYHLVMA